MQKSNESLTSQRKRMGTVVNCQYQSRLAHPLQVLRIVKEIGQVKIWKKKQTTSDGQPPAVTE